MIENEKDFEKFLKNSFASFKDDFCGCWFYELGTTKNGVMLYYVIGWQDADDFCEDAKTELFYSKQLNAILCGKIAVNCDILQDDFEIDWNMPYDETYSDVWFTDETFVPQPNIEKLIARIKNNFDDLKKLKLTKTGKVIK